jgi:homoserine kinase type II
MAVYTQLSDADLDALLAEYDLGRAVSLKGISEGVSNSNFKLETESGRFILTIFEARTEEAALPFFMGVMARLAERDFPARSPCRPRAAAC